MNDMIENLKSFAEMQEENTKPVENTDNKVESTVANVEENVETTSDDTDDSELDEDTEESSGKTEDDKTPWGKPGKVPKGILARFRKMNERDRQKDAKITELENAMKKFIEATSNGQQKREPTLQDFLEAGKSEADFIDYLVEQRISHKSVVDEQRRQQQETLKRTQEEINRKWTESFNKAKNDLPDYDEVIANADVILPTPTMRFITESDIGPYISYTIASDHNLQDKIDSMQNPADKHAVVVEVEKTIRNWLSTRTKKVSNSVGVQPQKEISNTKPKVPGTIKGAKSSKTLDPASASIEEWLGI